jgi:Haem-binding domain/Cytochrome P460
MEKEPMATKPPSRFRAAAWIVVALALAFLGIQFIRPELPNPPITADLQAPPQVKQILKNSCYNCHSNETRLSWFDEPAPAYWIVARDVKEARKHVNFSEIGKLPAGQQRAALFEGIFQVSFGAMPLPSYRRVHPGSTVTPEQLTILKQYLQSTTPNEPATPAAISSADAEYGKWMQAGGVAQSVNPAPNGIAFLPEYKNWKAISSTDRFDNGTIRFVLGNDIAIQAIAENHISPWPDGSAFAKVAWVQQPDEKNFVRTGSFAQVEFMIRDSKKYADTLGWGWARWRGADLKPYGKDANFTAECVGCHTPLSHTDHVFTKPIPLQQWNPSTPQGAALPGNPLQWRVITSAIDDADSSMCTLYGNDVAVDYARKNPQRDYPAGSIVSLVTWNQRDDDRWFGARIPGQVKTVEFVVVGAATDGRPSYSYSRYQGASLAKVSAEPGATPDERAMYLLLQRAAVMP